MWCVCVVVKGHIRHKGVKVGGHHTHKGHRQSLAQAGGKGGVAWGNWVGVGGGKGKAGNCPPQTGTPTNQLQENGLERWVVKGQVKGGCKGKSTKTRHDNGILARQAV